MFEPAIFSKYRAQGFVPLNGLFDKAMLGRLQTAATGLASRAQTQHASGEDIVLEAATGGWLAWQRGEPVLAGVVRSIANAHLYEPDIVKIASECAMGQNLISPAVGQRDSVFLTSFYWAKPPIVGSAKPWHQDMAYAPEGFYDNFDSVTTIWIAVDSATPNNGCLEFVRGSHRFGLVAHGGTAERKDGEPRNPAASEYQVDVCRLCPDPDPDPDHSIEIVRLSAGSAVMFDGYTVHRSSANTSTASRRAISLVFAY